LISLPMNAPQERLLAFTEKDPAGLRKKILFLTSSEYGQASVVLAVAYELLLRQTYDIHIASFAPLEGRVNDLNNLIPRNATPAVFHTIAGPSSSQVLEEKGLFLGPFSPGMNGALQTYRVTLPALATAWDISQYLLGYESCLKILQNVDPDLTVIEPLMDQGHEACNSLSGQCVILSPNTFQEILRKKQSMFTKLCRIPAISSGFSYPVPLHLIPANIYLNFQVILSLLASSKVRKMMTDRKSQGLPRLPPSYNIWRPENHYVLPSTTESEYPFYVPSNVTSCGPILLPALPLSETDPELELWLERAPTILINLGSIVRMDEAMTREFAAGLKLVLGKSPEIQVLWKIKRSGGLAILHGKEKSSYQQKDSARGPLEAISDEIASGRVKIVDWLSVDPLSILESGNVICSVHHGGSNSFHEALSAGTPQVILPCWFDTLDFANRVEWLGIGVHGSRCAAPSVESGELSRALYKVLGDSAEAAGMKKKAKALADIVGKVGGRKKACEKILELLEASRDS